MKKIVYIVSMTLTFGYTGAGMLMAQVEGVGRIPQFDKYTICGNALFFNSNSDGYYGDGSPYQSEFIYFRSGNKNYGPQDNPYRSCQMVIADNMTAVYSSREKAASGALKIMGRGHMATGGDKFWLGFCHGSDFNDSNDRARIGVEIASSGSGNMFFTTGTYGSQFTRMYISSEGKVGINNTTPTVNLEIGQDNASNTITQMIVHGGLKINNDKDVDHLTKVAINTNVYVKGAALTVGGPTYIGDYNDAENMVNANYLKNSYLWVKGGVVSENFDIGARDSWKDEIFQSDYQLPSPSEIAAYIRANKHLPGIPSALEVKEKGYNLHELHKGFLQHIEHLTLYAIAQETENKALRDQLNAMKMEHATEQEKESKENQMLRDQLNAMKMELEAIKQMISNK